MIARLLATLALAWMLSACQNTVIVPPWFAPHSDHSLECRGGNQGECKASEWGSRGDM